MKKHYILILLLLSFTINAQDDITFGFNTDGEFESWMKIPSGTTAVSVSGGALIVGGDITNYGGVMTGTSNQNSAPATELNINDSDYDYVEIVIQNNTTVGIPTNGQGNFQLTSYVTGSLAGATAGKANFSVPADGQFYTMVVFLPATPAGNAGVISNLGIRVKGNAAPGETVVIDQFTIKSLNPTYNGFVENPDFEDISGTLGGWSIIGTGITAAVSGDANSGTQSAEISFETTTASNPPTVWNNYRWPTDEGTTLNNVQTATVTWDMKYTDNPDGVATQIAPRWKMNIATSSSGATGDRVTYGAPTNATDAWATYTRTRTMSAACADVDAGANCFDDETYDNIELGMSAKGGAAGVKLLIDNVVTSISGTTLGTFDVAVADTGNISIYPNPVNDILNVKSNSEIIAMDVVNMLGQVVIKQFGRSNSLNVSTLSPGLYILKTKNENSSESIKRFVIK
jgi:hypothetical protein